MNEGGGQEKHDDAVSQETEVPAPAGTRSPASQGQPQPQLRLGFPHLNQQ